MKKYTYHNKATGERITSDTPLKKAGFVLIQVIRNGQMNPNRIWKKQK